MREERTWQDRYVYHVGRGVEWAITFPLCVVFGIVVLPFWVVGRIADRLGK